MVGTREQIIEERRRFRAEYGDLFDTVAALLFQHDPIGVAFDNPNTDEYEPEAGTILPRLGECHSVKDTLQVVHQEFVRWFGGQTAGPEEHYAVIASEIWTLWDGSRRPQK